MIYLLISFLAGILTVATPCVLPFLPVILGTSIDHKNKRRPFVIIASLSVAILILSTFILQFKSELENAGIRLDIIAGVIVTLFGLSMLFSSIWYKFEGRIGISQKANNIIDRGEKIGGTFGEILIGLALGLSFTGCSPTYGLIVAIILDDNASASKAEGWIYLFTYLIALAGTLSLIALSGQKLVAKLKWLSNPKSKVKILIAIFFVLFGITMATGIIKDIEQELVQLDFVTKIVDFEIDLTQDARNN